ncbi:hypothetical protein MT418_007771 [Batrachochytrium dendrobatidis]
MNATSSLVQNNSPLRFGSTEFRDRHFPQLVTLNTTGKDSSESQAPLYLDNAGAPPVPVEVVHAHAHGLAQTLLANPHSSMAAAAAYTSVSINRVRQRILRHFGVSTATHSVVFTANSTAAIKLVADRFPWSPKSLFCYHQSSHTSIIGIRSRFSDTKSVLCFQSEELDSILSLTESTNGNVSSINADETHHLLSYPAQSNFSGERFPLEWVQAVRSLDYIPQPFSSHSSSCHKSNWRVLIDCASMVSTTRLDLAKTRADFAVVSFYKMFGFPTSLGALIVRNDATSLLTTSPRKYFGGGTVAAIAANSEYHRFRSGVAEQLEEGTLPFTEILALNHGFEFVEKTIGGWDILSQHVTHLAEYAQSRLGELRHKTDHQLPVCKLYSPMTQNTKGPIIAFNIQTSTGTLIHHSQFMTLASIHNINIRSGCFCNPGACQQYLEISAQDIKQNHEVYGHVCGGSTDIGRPTGALRISFGFANIVSDVDRFLDFIQEFFVSKHDAIDNGIVSGLTRPRLTPYISAIHVYPIKSCGAISVTSWPMCDSGLVCDRKWMLVDRIHFQPLTQKKCPKMCRILIEKLDPYVGMMQVVYSSEYETHKTNDDQLVIMFDPIMPHSDRVPLNHDPADYDHQLSEKGDFSIVPKKISQADEWFSRHLGVDVCFVRSSTTAHIQSATMANLDKHHHTTMTPSFANKSPYLIISQSSYDLVATRVKQKNPVAHVDIMAFRPNLVIHGLIPFSEDQWISKSIQLGGTQFEIQEHCSRCQMICIDQATCKRHSEPLSTLAKMHRIDGRVVFGVHAWSKDQHLEFKIIHVGDVYTPPKMNL